MAKALVITADARVSLVDTPETDDLKMLKWLQAQVRGYVECIHPSDAPRGIEWHAYVNEDGRLDELSENLVATALAQRAGWMATDMLVGTVVFLGHDGEHECDVPAALVELGTSSGLLTGLRPGGDDGC